MTNRVHRGLELAELTYHQGEQAVDQLKDEIHNLMDELQALSMRNENLMGERERDAQALNDMEAKVEEYKKLYDSVRVELRNMKGEHSELRMIRPADAHRS